MVPITRVGMTVNVKLAVCLRAGTLESVTWNVSPRLVTAIEGVPVIVPVEAVKFKPAGSVPLVRAQVYGVVPPVAVTDAV